MKEDPILKAQNNLWLKNIFHYEGRDRVIACLIRQEDSRPFKAPWWKGKEVYLLGADFDGNFLLKHCDGSVRYWIHSEQRDYILASSLKDFLKSLSQSKDNIL